MALVKVWNRNVHPFTQNYKGQKISIPAQSFIEMDYPEAMEFKSAFFMPVKNGQGVQDPKSYKMIEVEQGTYTDTTTAFKSMVDGSLHLTKELRDAHDEAIAKAAPSDNEGAKIVRTKQKPTRVELGV